jgi:hypothetical protein
MSIHGLKDDGEFAKEVSEDEAPHLCMANAILGRKGDPPTDNLGKVSQEAPEGTRIASAGPEL